MLTLLVRRETTIRVRSEFGSMVESPCAQLLSRWREGSGRASGSPDDDRDYDKLHWNARNGHPRGDPDLPHPVGLPNLIHCFWEARKQHSECAVAGDKP